MSGLMHEKVHHSGSDETVMLVYHHANSGSSLAKRSHFPLSLSSNADCWLRTPQSVSTVGFSKQPLLLLTVRNLMARETHLERPCLCVASLLLLQILSNGRARIQKSSMDFMSRSGQGDYLARPTASFTTDSTTSKAFPLSYQAAPIMASTVLAIVVFATSCWPLSLKISESMFASLPWALRYSLHASF